MAEFSVFTEDAASLPSFGLDGSEVLSLGTEFYATTDAWVTHLRYPHTLSATPARKTMALYDTTGALVAGPVTMPDGTPGQWNSAPLSEPFKLLPGTHYRAVTFYPDGGYPAQGNYFNQEFFGDTQQFGPLIVPSSLGASSLQQGSFKYSTAIAYPDGSFNHTAYFSDVVATDTDPTPVVAPHNIFGASGTAYEAYALIDGILTPVHPEL